MAENSTEPKKRGRKKGSVSSTTSTKKIPRNLEKLSFEQLQVLSNEINDLIKSKKEGEIKVLKAKLEQLEKM